MRKPGSSMLPVRKPRAWEGPRRKWHSAQNDLRDPEKATRYLMEAKATNPEAYAIAKQEVDLVRMTQGNKAVRTFTCHDTASGAARLYVCAA